MKMSLALPLSPLRLIKVSASRERERGLPIFFLLEKETVALPLPFLTFHLNSLTRRSSNPSLSPLPVAFRAGGIDLLTNRGRIIRKNRARRPASHLRRNKFQRRNSETEEEGVICYRRKRGKKREREEKRARHNLDQAQRPRLVVIYS